MVHSTRPHRTAAAFALALAVALPAAAASANQIGKIGIENFGQVNDHFYRGAQPYGRDYEDLAAMGVRVIIDLQDTDGDRDEVRLARAAGITYYRIPMSTRRPPTNDQLATFFRLVSDPANPVYVHCKGGRHRTGVMTAAYRMAFDRWTADRAFAEMKRYDFGLDFLHPEFKKYVYTFDASRAPMPAAVAATQQN
jgi:protein tyrosine/serine phosphatase